MSKRKIIIAPNAFKGALSAEEAANAIQRGLAKSDIAWEIIEIPIADGGDGSLSILAKYLEVELRETHVKGPVFSEVKAKWGYKAEKYLGIIELAEASGIRLLAREELNPMQTSSFGTGQLMKLAVEAGAKEIYLTVGGSATVDLGMGIMEALGARFYSVGREVKNITPINFMDIDHIELQSLQEFKKKCKCTILCDVNNPLVGPEGAAHVFGPQKGANKGMVDQLEQGIIHMAKLFRKAGLPTGGETGVPMMNVEGGGAAGGVAAGLFAAIDASIVNGGKKILELAQFEDHLKNAELVITGEGKIDEQTNYGKGPGLVAQLAHEHGVKVIGLSGSLDEDTSRIKYFDQLIAISDKNTPLEISMQHTASNLEKAAALISSSYD